VVAELGVLFKSVGPLDELILSRCDLYSYLDPFFDPPVLKYAGRPITFPPIKELTILHPAYLCDGYTAAIVNLAKSQHAFGIPFERVTIRAQRLPKAVAEMLDPWVGEVNCYEE